jgi:pyrroline-5-carboxylate reductase
VTFELVVVGGGNMGSALLTGLLERRADRAGIAVVEVDPVRRELLVGRFPGVEVATEVPQCTAAILAVKPPDITASAVVAAAAGARRILSIAAGISTATVDDALTDAGHLDVAVLRAMPNTASLVGRGVAALCGGAQATEADLEWAVDVLGAVGSVSRLPESSFDAVTGLTGSGPAYLFLVAEALVDAGVLAGLPRPVAESMVADLFVGSAALLREQGDAAALRAMVTSPAGTTAAAIQVLEARAVRAAFVDAVMAAAARSRELAGS